MVRMRLTGGGGSLSGGGGFLPSTMSMEVLVKRTTTIMQLKKCYSKKFDVVANDLKWMYDGDRIQNDFLTLQELNVEDVDEIDVFQEQEAGHLYTVDSN